MAINNILVTETTPKVARRFSIHRADHGILIVRGEPNGDIALETGHHGILVGVSEAKALIEVLQELTK